MPRHYLMTRGMGTGIKYQGVFEPTYAHPSAGPQGLSIKSPWSESPKKLGRPGTMKAEGPQGIGTTYRGVKQGKFSGDDRYARNTKNRPAQAAPATAWPNKGSVENGRIRGRRG